MSKTVKASENLFSAFGVPAQAARNLQIRSTLMIEIAKYVKRQGMTQAEAAEYFGVSQPYISDLVNGRIDRVSIDKLVSLLERAGRQVTVRVNSTAN